MIDDLLSLIDGVPVKLFNSVFRVQIIAQKFQNTCQSYLSFPREFLISAVAYQLYLGQSNKKIMINKPLVLDILWYCNECQ